jgi:hypothetical protein
VQQYDIAEGGRRLRELYAERKDIKREWVLDEKGKRLYKEYWMELPKPQTKQQTIAKYTALELFANQ